MSDSRDFFVVGGTLRPQSPSYVQRPADQELFDSVLVGEFCYVLTARQMGKSSLMIHTARRLDERAIRSVIIDLTSIGTVSIDEWYLGLLTRIRSGLRLAVDVHEWWAARGSMSAPQRLIEFLCNVVLKETETPVVIFVDEIDTTLNLNFRDDFFAAIRAIYNDRANDPAYKRLTFVLLGVATPTDLIQDRDRTPFNIGRRIVLQELSYVDAEPLRFGLEQQHAGHGDAMLARIFHWTNGHPYLTQKLCAAATQIDAVAWDDAEIDRLVAANFLVDDARDDNLKFVQNRVQANPAPMRRKMLNLYRRVYGRASVPDDDRSRAQNELELSGLVRVDQGQLRVRNPIYRQVFDLDWVRENMPADTPRNLAIGLTAAAVMIVGLVIYLLINRPTQGQIQAGEYVNVFRGAGSAAERINALARLFDLGASDPDAPIVARALFYGELDAGQQQALFRNLGQTSQQQKDLSTVVSGLGAALNTVPGSQADNDWQLMDAMIQALIDAAPDEPLISELTDWKRARKNAGRADYDLAIRDYDKVIKLDGEIPALRYDRALAFVALNKYSLALADLNAVVEMANRMPGLSSSTALDSALIARVRNSRFIDSASITTIVQTLLRGDERLQLALQTDQASYPTLAEQAKTILNDLASRQARQTAAAQSTAPTAVRASQATAQPRSEPARPVIAFYYAWYDMGDWTSGKTSNGDLPNPTYDSSDDAAIARHIQQADDAGIDALACAWKGPDDARTTNNCRKLLKLIEASGRKIRMAMFADEADTGWFVGNEGAMVKAIQTLKREYMSSPAYFTIAGRPLVLSWRAEQLGDVAAWQRVRDQVDPNREQFWMGGTDQFSYLDVFDSLFYFDISWEASDGAAMASYAQRLANYNRSHSADKPFIATVEPGYNDVAYRQKDGHLKDRGNGDYYRGTWQTAIERSAAAIVLTSFNEFYEGSYIEPSKLYGDLYLQLTKELITQFHSAPSATARGQPRIAFTSTRDGNSEIYVMNADGTNQRRLTENPAGDAHPEWSPDGKQIAFETDRDGNDEIYVMNAEGGEARNLSANPASDLQPAWSPDGSKIVFISDRDGNLELYLMNADGTQPRRLTTNPGIDVTPVWSPDGRRIAFTTERSGNREIAVIDADGTNLTILTNHPADDQQPTWAPDGKQIAFSTDRDGNSEIYVMDADGANQRNLSNHPANERFPAWSPDGRQIAFDTDRDGGALNFEIYVMDADGANQRDLTSSPGRDRFPAWSSASAGVATATTPEQLPTPLPSPAPTATPCAAPSGVFAQVWQDDPSLRQALGCPSGTAAIGSTATQYYPGGTLYWAETQPRIYVLYGGETGTWQRLSIVGDTALQYDCPAGSYLPVRGFGNLLAAHPNVAEKLGRCGTTPEEPEQPDSNGSFQRFEGGAMLFIGATKSTGEGRVWILFDNGTFKRVAVASQ